jgi:hypothetical protein
VKLPDESSFPTFVPLCAKYSVEPDGVTAHPPETETPPEVPVVFWFKVGKVQLVSVPDAGVPNAGVTRVGLVANTSAPEPVSSLTADARLVDDGVAKKVATPVPSPLMPVETGRPVALVSVPLEGVPRAPLT